MSSEDAQLSFDVGGEAAGEAQPLASRAAAGRIADSEGIDLTPAPTPEQQAAIDARAVDVFCEAGAGSGKTRVLVGRYCDALTKDGVSIDEILAFTFTERAAAELRGRIRLELGRRSRIWEREGDTVRAAELQALARETERAWVTTIHGFCRRLLGAHPIAAGLDPRFRVLDAPESARLREQAAREALEALITEGIESVTRAAAAYRPDRFSGIALDAHERLRSQGMIEPRLPPVGEPILSKRPDAKPKKGEKDAEPTLSPAEREAALRAREALELLLERTHSRYGELKAARSGLDFSDLELITVKLLGDSPAVAELWRGRFRHLMVDEFQDTNAVQLALISALRGPETRLFTVGDEQQSIYRFRAADLEVFRDEREKAQAAAGTEVLPLRGNFRSSAPVLAAANEVGRTLLPGFQELTCGRDEPAPAVELLLTLDEGSGKDARKWKTEEIDLCPPPSVSQPVIFAEALALAERLSEIVEAREAQAGEIVVLLRAFTHVDAYEEALRRFGLDPYVVGGRGYWSQQQVEDLLRLLSCVANPLDDEMLFGALAAPGVGVSPDALWLLRAAAGGRSHIWPVLTHVYGGEEHRPDALDERQERIDAISGEDAERLRLFCERLAPLRARAALTSLDALVEETMNAFGYDLALLARDGGRGRMANVRKLMRLASEYERNEGRDLRGFLDQAFRSTERDEREGMAPVNAEDHDGVRIMTVHGAKGLEFPVVAMPDMGRRLNAGHRAGDLWIGRRGLEGGEPRFGMRLAFPTEKSMGVWELFELDAEENEAEAEEACRLLYVAATRAERRLLLSGSYRPQHLEPLETKKPGDTALRRLLPALVELGWDGSAPLLELPAPSRVDPGDMRPLPVPELAIRVNSPSPGRAEALRAGRPETAREAEPIPGAVRPPLLPSGPSPVPLGHLSYSALASFERCGYRFYLERVLGVREGDPAFVAASEEEVEEAAVEGPASDELVEPQEEEGREIPHTTVSPALALGNAVHLALEWSARNRWRDPGSDRIAALLEREGLPGEEPLKRATAVIGGWMQSRLRAELEGLRLRPEVPFALGLGGTVMRGSIDLLAEDPAGNAAPLVVDFKTDATRGRDTGELGERYAGQRAVYALAVAEATGSEEVRTAHVFLEHPAEPVAESFGAERLATARSELEALIARVREGRFEVAADPYAAMCFRCPAAARLCPRPAWRPRAA
jgi:ATP-dependent helicase/nuclease subunit A